MASSKSTKAVNSVDLESLSDQQVFDLISKRTIKVDDTSALKGFMKELLSKDMFVLTQQKEDGKLTDLWLYESKDGEFTIWDYVEAGFLLYHLGTKSKTLKIVKKAECLVKDIPYNYTKGYTDVYHVPDAPQLLAKKQASKQATASKPTMTAEMMALKRVVIQRNKTAKKDPSEIKDIMSFIEDGIIQSEDDLEGFL